MGQRRRHDGPGVWHHVANRGIARRSVFEVSADVRFFLSRLARAYRKGLLEIHGYCMMITHFHLLVRSPVGQLSDTETGTFFRYSHKRSAPHATIDLLASRALWLADGMT